MQATSSSTGTNKGGGDARSTLIKLVEEHLTHLISEADVIKRQCKRARLHQVGNNDYRGVVRRRLHADDINLALQWRGSEKLYATGTVIPLNNNNNNNNNNNDEEVQDDASKIPIDLEDYLKSEMQLRPPLEVGLTSHWLAVDGQQPEIPQNPVGTAATAAAGGGDGGEGGPRMVESDPLLSSSSFSDAEMAARTKSGIRVSQLLPMLLSEELQLYFTRITLAIQRGGATPVSRQQQDAALASVATDIGLQELVPFFVKYLSQELNHHVGNPDHCRTLVRLAMSMLHNPHLHLELHLHQLLPALMTCVVATKLSSRPTDNHWALRREAAQALIVACNLFGEEYATLKSRVLRTLCDATSPEKSLTTQYGGIVAISLFGAKAIDAFLLPVVSEYWQKWDDALATSTDIEQRLELLMCQEAVLNALGIFMRRVSSVEQMSRVSWEELEGTFGDRLVAFMGEETEYASCVV